jgi:transcriptional regulator with XRE-family HTH domain
MKIQETVTPEWVQSEMKRTGLTVSKLSEFTGITRQQISGWTSGANTMSQAVKIMFYLVFLKRESLEI